MYQLLNWNVQKDDCWPIQPFHCEYHPCMINTNKCAFSTEHHSFCGHIFGSTSWFHSISWTIHLVAGSDFYQLNSTITCSSEYEFFLASWASFLLDVKDIVEYGNNMFDTVNITRFSELESLCQRIWYNLSILFSQRPSIPSYGPFP